MGRHRELDEHTAYVRLKQGIRRPESGTARGMGRSSAEQIGAQIFIDGWAMVAPGDPELAADLARRAASVSHDGEAVYGAQVIAAMEAHAFVEPDLQKLLDTGLSVIPRDTPRFPASSATFATGTRLARDALIIEPITGTTIPRGGRVGPTTD